MRRQPQICPEQAAIPIKALGNLPEDIGCGRGKTEGDSFPKRHGNHIEFGKKYAAMASDGRRSKHVVSYMRAKGDGKKRTTSEEGRQEKFEKPAEGGRKKVTPAQPHGGVFAKWSCKWAENSHFSCAPSRPIRPIPARRRSSAPATSSRLSSFALAPECYRGVTLLRAVVGFGCSEVLVCDVPSARRRPSRSGVTAESRSCVRMSGSSVPFRLACLVGEGRDSRLPLLCILGQNPSRGNYPAASIFKADLLLRPHGGIVHWSVLLLRNLQSLGNELKHS